MKIKELRQTKGITLIALIVTVIILLILAGVSISAISGDGLFSRARGAASKYEIAAQQESISLAMYEYTIANLESNSGYMGGKLSSNEMQDLANYYDSIGYEYVYLQSAEMGAVQTDGGTTWIAIHLKKKASDTVEFVITRTGRILNTSEGEIEKSVLIADANTENNGNNGGSNTPTPPAPTKTLSSIAITTQPTKTSYEEYESLDLTGIAITATYSDNSTANVTSSATFSPANGTTLSTGGTQTITASYTEGGVTKTATTSVTVTLSAVETLLGYTGNTNSNDLVVGDHINYYYANGTAPIECVVLYKDATHGIQVVSADTVRSNITLGSSDFETSKASYNSAVSTLNAAANSYVPEGGMATDGRCVGSNPLIGQKNSAESNAMMIASNDPSGSERAWMTSNGWYNSFKLGDQYYSEDYNTMKNMTTPIHNLGKNYWLASRNVNADSFGSYFKVRYVGSDGSASSYDLCDVSDFDDEYSLTRECAFRPVFLLKSDIPVEKIS